MTTLLCDPYLAAGCTESEISRHADAPPRFRELDERDIQIAMDDFSEAKLPDIIASLGDHGDAQIGAMVRREWDGITDAMARR